MRWECWYSSCEVMYLEVRAGEVVSYLDHSPTRPDRWAFADVLAGRHDAEVRALFGDATVAELKAAVRRAEA